MIRKTRSIACALAILSSVCLADLARAHEAHLSFAEIEHNAKASTLEISLRLDGEHLEEELGLERDERVRLESTEGIDELLAAYLKKHLRLEIDDKPCSASFVGKELGVKATWLYFEIALPHGSSGGTLRNSVLTALDDLAGPRGRSAQVNAVTYRADGKRRSFRLSRTKPAESITWPACCQGDAIDHVLEAAREGEGETLTSTTTTPATPAARAAAEAPAARLLHRFEKIQLTDRFHAEGADVADIDHDGDLDVFSGPYWYEAPAFTARHEILEPRAYNPQGYSRDFQSFAGDIDRDGWSDVVIVEFPGEKTVWYRNPGAEKKSRWDAHVAVEVTDNESPQFVDLTGDGHAELVFHTGGVYGYATPDPAKPTALWTFHPISEKVANGRFQHGLGTGDVNGDGRLDVLSKDGWLEQPASLEGDPGWTFHRFGFTGAGGSDMFAYDFDGDGDNDVLTTIEAHGYGLAWYEQTGKDASGEIEFKPHVIFGRRPQDNEFGVCFTQMHSVSLIDMDGDGLRDIVTGKRFWAHNGHDPEGNRPAVLYWLRTERSAAGRVRFVPYLVDDNSGVGTQVVTADLDRDGFPEIIVGNKKGAFVFRHTAEKVSEEVWREAQPKPVN